MVESEEEPKRLWMKVKEKSEKAGLKLNIQKAKITASSPITSWQRDGKRWKQWQILFSSAPKSLWAVTAAWKWKTLAPWKERNKPRQHIKKQTHHVAYKVPFSQSYGFSNSHVWMWKLDHVQDLSPEELMLSNFVVLKTHESPLDCKEIKPVNFKGNQPWIFIVRTVAETEAPILWPHDMKS